MATRVISALLLGFLFLFLSLQSFWWVLFAFTFIHAVAQHEFCGLLKSLPPAARIAHIVGTTVAFILICLSLTGQSAPEMIAVVLMLLAIYYAIREVTAYEAGGDPQVYIRLLLSTLLVTLPCALCVAVAAWPGDFPYLLLLIGASWGSDTGAIFAGKFAGKNKLAPRTSPKKTVEGLLGGAASAAAIFAAALIMFPADSPLSKLGLDLLGTVPGALILAAGGFVIALIGVYGDLLFSMLKREADVKDYGQIVPGHGGILDRFDSMLLVAPLIYLLAFI
jgi:phosphatidate cytidylyltransferase